MSWRCGTATCQARRCLFYLILLRLAGIDAYQQVDQSTLGRVLLSTAFEYDFRSRKLICLEQSPSVFEASVWFSGVHRKSLLKKLQALGQSSLLIEKPAVREVRAVLGWTQLYGAAVGIFSFHGSTQRLFTKAEILVRAAMLCA